MAGRFSVETVFKGVDRITSVVARIQAKSLNFTSSFSKNVKQMDDQLSKVTGSLARVGAAAGAAAIAAGAGMAWAGKAGLDFEEAITAVGAVSLMTRDQIQDLEKKALELGSTTKFTATEAANAMEIMGRAGFTNAQILEGIGGIMNAAAAEGAEMAEVTSHVSNVLKGMGLEADQAGRVADVLTLASARTNSSISSLGESMKNLSPVAKQFGISLEDSVTMVAMLQDVGLDASEAGTATATMLTKLAAPADEVAAKMKELGIAFKDANGNMLPPMKVFENMKAAAGKLGGNMDQVAFFADLVGLRGQKAALNLKDLFTSDNGQRLSAELQNAAGSAEKMAKLRLDNVKGSWTLFENAVDGVKIALFGLAGVDLKGIIDGMTGWVSANKDLIVSGAKDFFAWLKDSLPTIVTWLTRIGKVVTVFLAFAAAVKVVATAMAVWNAMAVNPIVLLVYAIVAAIALIWAFWPEISAFFGMVWEKVKSIGRAVADFFTAIFEAWVGLAVLIWGPIINLVIGFAKGILSYFAPLLPFFQWVWEGVKAAFSGAWEFISGMISFYADLFMQIWSPIADFFAGLWDTIAAGFESAFGWVIAKIEWAVASLRTIGRGFLGGDAPPEVGGGAGGQMVSPQDRTARSISEQNSTTTNRSEVTVKAGPGASAEVTKRPSKGSGLNLKPSGSFG